MILHLIKPGSRGADTVARFQQLNVTRQMLVFGSTWPDFPPDFKPEQAVLYDLPHLDCPCPHVHLGDGGELQTDLFSLPQVGPRAYKFEVVKTGRTWNQDLDIWVVPSGTPPAEVAVAMAHETLVLVPAEDLYRDLVMTGVTGFTYAVQDEAVLLAHCLEYDISTRQEVASRGRHWVHQTADIQLLVGAIHGHRRTIQCTCGPRD